MLQIATRIPMPDTPGPFRVGIGDWAVRKGSRYGTIVVDLDRHRVIDLLPDRSASTLASWLERHSDVELVARDCGADRVAEAQACTPSLGWSPSRISVPLSAGGWASYRQA